MESADAFHVSTMQVQRGRDANFKSLAISLGAALARNDINAVLSEGTECTLNGFYLVSGTQHTDTHTAIDHAKLVAKDLARSHAAEDKLRVVVRDEAGKKVGSIPVIFDLR